MTNAPPLAVAPAPATSSAATESAALGSRGQQIATRLTWYAGTAALVLFLAAVGYRLDEHDLRVPLLYFDPRGLESDTLLILPMVKCTIERGSHWTCDRLGAPGIQEMHDFPVIDHFHFAAIWVLGLFTPDPFLVFNLYYLLGFPLAALTAMLVLRHFRLSFPAAAVGGVIFAFLPYHLQRGENHYFLSAYYIVPITIMVILWICDGRLPFFPARPAGERRLSIRDRTTLLAVLVAVVTASAGAYYAFFACVLLVAAGVYGWVTQRTWRASASAGLVATIIFAVGLAHHIPAFVYHSRNGPNAGVIERFSEEAEFFGLKLSLLLLPIDDHSLKTLSNLKATYNSPDRPVQTWTERYSLGTISSLGLLFLLFRAVFPVARGWPYAPLTVLTLFALLVGTVGGFGVLFNHLVTPQVRCYNRLVVYIAFLSLFAVLHLADRAAAWAHQRTRGRFWLGTALPALAWVALAWFAVWDQTPFYWGGTKTLERNQLQRERFAADVDFFREVEDVLNPERDPNTRPMVFQLPYVRWPESPPQHQLWCYEHNRGFMHTQTLRWSFGCMKYRETDEWYRSVYVSPVKEMLVRVVRAGFDGLMLDKRGYSPATGEAVHHQLIDALGSPRRVTHADGKQIFFDLRPYRDWIRAQTPGSWEEQCWRELHPVTILWLDGFVSVQSPGREWMQRWCGAAGLAIFVNPTDEPKTFRSEFHIRTMSPKSTDLVIDGGSIWSESITINNQTPLLSREFTIPPGRHVVRFRSREPEEFIPSDSRRLFYFISGLKIE